MPSTLHRASTVAPRSLHALTIVLALSLFGCANPGPPRPPSLNLPGPVANFTALRRGNAVELRFTLPQRNTDHLQLRGATVRATLCRAVDNGTCLPLPASQNFPLLTAGHPTEAVLQDILPEALTFGAPRELSYRVELFNESNRSAGFSDPAFTLAGATPLPLNNFAAQGSRLGILLSWDPSPPDDSFVAVRRENLAPTPQTQQTKAKTSLDSGSSRSENQPIVWLSAPNPDPTHKLLDTSALPGTPYSYTAERRRTVTLGSRTLEMRSTPSPSIIYVLRDVYPPPVPTDLTAAVFAIDPANPSAGAAVDLIWQPVEDPGLRGYLVYRQTLGAKGEPSSPPRRLTAHPLSLPAFHDKLPSGATHLRYSVTAVDEKGNESSPAVATVDATP